MKLYDTCALLNLQERVFTDYFYISNITLQELSNIKESFTKDLETKFKARRLTKLLYENKEKYEILYYNDKWDEFIKYNPILSDNNDCKIITTALKMSTEDKPILFVTHDLLCLSIAEVLGLSVEYKEDNESTDYCGYKIIECKDEDDLANLYKNLYDPEIDFKMCINEYIIIKDSLGNIIDKYKYTEEGFKPVPFGCCESKMFGKVKAKDDYQQMVIDSFKNNKITLIRGSAGTGKSYLSIAYLFSLLEKEKINKIIIFCNTIATSGSAKLGFYPGSKDEKLLDSQIGNFLASKLGNKDYVERLVEENKLELLPLSDIRGYDSTGLKAGIYITEAQNLSIELMKLALQRIGEDSICIIEGDSNTQVDLPIYGGYNNGMKRVSEVFRGDPIYGEVKLVNIYRSRIANLAENM